MGSTCSSDAGAAAATADGHPPLSRRSMKRRTTGPPPALLLQPRRSPNALDPLGYTSSFDIVMPRPDADADADAGDPNHGPSGSGEIAGPLWRPAQHRGELVQGSDALATSLHGASAEFPAAQGAAERRLARGLSGSGGPRRPDSAAATPMSRRPPLAGAPARPLAANPPSGRQPPLVPTPTHPSSSHSGSPRGGGGIRTTSSGLRFASAQTFFSSPSSTQQCDEAGEDDIHHPSSPR